MSKWRRNLTIGFPGEGWEGGEAEAQTQGASAEAGQTKEKAENMDAPMCGTT